VTAGSIGLFTYSTVPRGSVVHTAHLADALHDAGADVTVYALDKDGRGFFRPLRARLRLVPAQPAPPSTFALVRQRTAELGAYLARERPRHDIVHAQDCLTASALVEHLDHAGAPPLVRTVHHVEQFASPALAACQERSIRRAAMCLAVSAAAARDVRATFDIACRRVTNGVAFARFASPDPARVAAWRHRLGAGDAPILLAVGGVEERKNTAAILAAFAELAGRWPRARLVILGGATVLDHGAYRAGFDRALAGLPAAVRANVVELGVVGEDDVPAVFAACSVLVFASLHEGFGLAALEALAAGLPVVVSDRPPMTEFLDDRCAVLVDPRSPASIAHGVARALAGRASADPAALATAAARRTEGLRRAAQQSWQRVAALHLDHYAHLALTQHA